MEQLTIEDLDRRWAEVETAVDATPGIDPWCSGLDWQLPVTLGFAPTATRLLLATDDGRGFALLASYRDPNGTQILSGLEPLWGFGSPIVGPDPGAIGSALATELGSAIGSELGSGQSTGAGIPDLPWQTMILPGLPPISQPTAPTRRDDQERRPGSPGGFDPGHHTSLPLAMALASLGRAGFAEGITRQLIDLDDGYDAWLQRRSPKFRRNLRRAERQAAEAGLTIVDGADDPDIFDRLLAIEQRSWKGLDGSGITGDAMTVMYRTMVERLRARDRLLVHLAVLDGTDVGYILGGVRNRRYRGLQLSYTDDAANLSVGNVLQAHQLAQLDNRDLADVYDLGMDFDYKRRWADRAETSVVLVVQR